MKIRDILEGKSENRELWDRIKSKGVVPSIDRERYTDMSDQGLEGPFRMKNGQVLYYDPKEGKYYNRDTDMYVSYDEYRAMDEAGDKRPGYVVKASDKPKTVKPNTGGSSKHPYQGKLVGEAEVGNTDYEFTHGKKPKGHGSWFFVAHRGGINFGKDIEGEDYIQLHQMNYGDAKKAAIKWAKSKGHTSLFVAT